MSTTTSTILLAEEHDATRAFLADNLTADGYRVLIACMRVALHVLALGASGEGAAGPAAAVTHLAPTRHGLRPYAVA